MLKRLVILMCMLIWPIAAQAWQADIFVHGLSKVADIHAGAFHNVALLKDGNAMTWGASPGNGQNPGLIADVYAVGAGDYHTLVAHGDGSVQVFGQYAEPNDDTVVDIDATTEVPTDLTGVLALTGGLSHSAAITSDHKVRVWGQDFWGEISNMPDFTGKTITEIAAGHHHTLALDQDGKVYAWGRNIDGETTIPDEVANGIVVAIAAKAFNSAALLQSGKVIVWGNNDSGQRTVPLEAQGGVTAIALGGHHALAILDGKVLAWGATDPADPNYRGQSNVPPNLQPATKVTGGAFFSMAVLGNDDVVGWGDNGATQLKVPLAVYDTIQNGNVQCTEVNTDDPPPPNTFSTCTITPTGMSALSLFTVNGVDQQGAVTPNGDGTFTYMLPMRPGLYDSITAAFGTGDVVAPTVTAFTVPANSPQVVQVSSFTATDNVGGGGVAGYLITQSSQPPSPTDQGWQASAPTTFNATGTGSVTLYAWAKDVAGNVSQPLSATTNIGTDMPPVVTQFSAPTVAILAMFHIPGNIPVQLRFTATDDKAVTGYLITQSNIPPNPNGGGWLPAAPTMVTVNTATMAALYGWAKDASGNVSQPGIILISGSGDLLKPTVTSFVAPTTSTSTTVPITAFTARDNVGVTGYLITTISTPPKAADLGWTATAPTTFAAGQSGTFTLYAWAKDAAGNVSAPLVQTVRVDTLAPSVTSFTLPVLWTESLTVPINSFIVNDNLGVTGFMVTESSTAPLATDTRWQATAPTSFTFTTPGAKTLYAWVKDSVGNVSGGFPATTNIDLTQSDSIPPTVTSFQAPLFGFVGFLGNSGFFSLPIASFTATDNKKVTGYLITQGTIPTAATPGWSPTPPTLYRFNLAGQHVLIGWARDAAGNVSAPFFIGGFGL